MLLLRLHVPSEKIVQVFVLAAGLTQLLLITPPPVVHLVPFDAAALANNLGLFEDILNPLDRPSSERQP